MALDFYRVVEGYNKPFFKVVSASLARNAELTINAPSGPGRVYRIIILIQDTHVLNAPNNSITLTIDGSQIMSHLLEWFAGGYEDNNLVSPWTARDNTSSFSHFYVLHKFDYMSSLSITLKNTYSPDPTYFAIAIWGETGY